MAPTVDETGSLASSASQDKPFPAPALGRFVFVMGAGVISLGLSAAGRPQLSDIFLVVAAAGYVELWLTQGYRILLRPGSLLTAAGDVRYSLGCLTLPVSTLVLATRFTILGLHLLGVLLFVAGGTLALGGVYLVPSAVILGPFKPGRLKAGGGLWLLWPVSLDALSVASSTVVSSAHFEAGPLTLLAVSTWALALMLYLLLLAALGGLILSTDIRLADLGPSYWVTMGAAALSALAAALLAQDAGLSLIGNPAELAGMALLFGLALWFLATALLPLVVGLSLARTMRRDRLQGAPKELWVAVFPAAMYGLAAQVLGRAGGYPWLTELGRTAVWLGVAVFLIEVGRGVLLRLLPDG